MIPDEQLNEILTLFSNNMLIVLASLGGIAAISILRAYFLWHDAKRRQDTEEEFITIISHKFHTPLSQIKWLTEVLYSDEHDPYRLENLRELRKANQKLIELVSTLVELTDSDKISRSVYSFETVNADDFVGSVANSFKDLFHEKNIFFAINRQATTGSIKIDRARMEYVLRVLLENAYAYTPPGKDASITITKSCHKIVISVVDSGIGMTPDDITRVFSKFFRSQAAQSMDSEGFGIGLHLARAIVRRHRGKIEVFSGGTNKGSTFRIILPLTK